ncbi:Maf family protein [uncultured Ferrovibrio sp.]|jgi:septum formation protein|uniref:Maf family protein n=1 Tax=uncultured Ferrovibrio sp. TaxID=1576913 RepID=UPI00261CCC66|nr:Maf family protein [uncultured Ferrovibrio sp.]
MTIILASASASRAALLRSAGLEFDVQPARVDEEEIKLALRAEGATPQRAAEALAELKAHRVSPKTGEDFVIAADQMLVCEDRWYDKPRDIGEAREHLLSLRGKNHDLISAVVLARGGSIIWRHVDIATLTMRNFSEDFLDAYLAQAGEAVLHSVGCYQLEGLGVQLFSRIRGDFFTILGLPLLPLLDILRENKVLRA